MNNKLVNTVKRIMENDELNEMAQIAGALKDAIDSVIKNNPELEGLALKKAIRGDAQVIAALAGDQLYDNQLNRFIALVKGERELGQRGRKPGSVNASVGKSVMDKFAQGLYNEYTPEEKQFIADLYASVQEEDMDMPMEEAEASVEEVELNEQLTRMQKLAGVIKG